MLVNMRDVLTAADKYRFGQAAFNVNSVAQIQAAIEAHEILRSPAILQGANLANGFMGGCIDFPKCTIEDKRKGAKNIGDAVRKYAENSPIPVVLHLDHGSDFESCVAAIDGGYTSVMIDGSHLSFDDNVELTREVVKYAHARGISVEGELGILAGVEDDVFSESSTYTNPLKAIEFFKKTEVDALAISYGTMHGPNKGQNTVIRKEIPMAIKECMRHENIDGFLVSHGSSTVPQHIVEGIIRLGGEIKNAHGINMNQLIEVCHAGINKINVDTDIRLATTRRVRELLQLKPEILKNERIAKVNELLLNHPSFVDPRAYLHPLMDMLMYGTVHSPEEQLLTDVIMKATQEIVYTLCAQFGSVGKADYIEPRTLEQMAKHYQK
ncbi:MAG: class II fructose-bisphosphate aldolase [Aerococcaceae bacterium]|nr:class II fructose-bisphosphate aldolase [Aerococcaceae bacterium]